MSDLQALRIPGGWRVEWNVFTETAVSEENIHWEFASSSMLLMKNDRLRRALELTWAPQGDVNGSYVLETYNVLEEWNEKSKRVEQVIDFEQACSVFKSRNRLEIVQQIEILLVNLEPFTDPRIFTRRGVVDEKAEKVRLQILNNALSPDALEELLTNGHAINQSLFLDQADTPLSIIKQLAQTGKNKGVRNKARQKMQQNKFRS